MKCNFAGRFKLDVHSVDEAGNVIPGSHRSTGWFNNLITDVGLDLLGGSSQNFLGRCFIGTSNTPPAVTDTALGGQVAFANRAGNPATSTGAAYVGAVCTYTFTQGAAVGNMQEIGIGTTGNSLFSRALIVDGNGDPTVLVLTSIDILTVTYELRLYPSQADDTDTITDGATTYTVVTRTARGLNADQVVRWNADGPFGSNTTAYTTLYAGSIGPWTGVPSGANAHSGNNPTIGAYTPGSHQRSCTANFSISTGNVPGGLVYSAAVRPATSNVCCSLQASFAPPIAKDNTKTLSLTWRISWGREP